MNDSHDSGRHERPFQVPIKIKLSIGSDVFEGEGTMDQLNPIIERWFVERRPSTQAEIDKLTADLKLKNDRLQSEREKNTPVP